MARNKLAKARCKEETNNLKTLEGELKILARM